MAENNKNKVQAEKCRALGSKNFQAGSFHRALELYSKGIEFDPENAILYSNRAATQLMIGNAEKALEDAERGLVLDPANVKLMYRKAKSMMLLKKYHEAVRFLTPLTSQQQSADLARLLEKSAMYVQESEHGKYDMKKIYNEVKTDPILDHAEYQADHLVDFSRSHSVAKQSIASGTLLLAYKAAAYAKSIGPEPDKVKQELCFLLANFLRKNSSVGRSLFGIESSEDCDFDSKVQQIVDRNQLAFARDQVNADSAAWTAPLFFKHSCCNTNVARQVVGDFYFVRAARNIECGEELKLCRLQFDSKYSSRCEMIKKMGLEPCLCDLCQIEADFPKKSVAESVATLERGCDAVREGFHQKCASGELHSTIEKLEELYEQARELEIETKFNVLARKIAELLAIAFRIDGRLTESARLFEENIEFFERLGAKEHALDSLNILLNIAHQLGDEQKCSWCFDKGVELAKIVIGDESLLQVHFDRQREIGSNSFNETAAVANRKG